jgi:16S rRNA (cytosine967-C5)-methyltransferase
MAAGGAFVTAIDVHAARARLIARNAARLSLERVDVMVADGRRPPHRSGTFDRVLVDAPCSGLGVLRRRPDARWHVRPDDIDDLVALQRALLVAAARLVRDEGTLLYAVCTLTRAETVGIDEWLATTHPRLIAREPPGDPWQPVGRGARLLPQTAGTDGMFVLGLTARR